MLRRAYCRVCGDYKPFDVTKPNHILHLLITVFLFGMWLPVWILLALFGGHSNCTTCGSKETGCLRQVIQTLAGLAVVAAAIIAIGIITSQK